MADDENELKEFTVGWSIKLSAFDAQHAATKAHDVLRSRQPVQLSVYKGHSTRNPVKVIPDLETHISAAIRRFFPTATVEIENDGDTEETTITVISEFFRDLPGEDERIAMVSNCLSALPDTVLENFSYSCYTQGEYEQYCDSGLGDDGWLGPDDQPGGEGAWPVSTARQSDGDSNDTESRAMDIAVSNPSFVGKIDV